MDTAVDASVGPGGRPEAPARSPRRGTSFRAGRFGGGLQGVVALGVIGVAVAALLYQPWRPVPFDVIDFSEFLPLLLRHGGVGERLSHFVHYYASQGRLNVLSYVFIVAKWEFFGLHTAAWQWARFCQMCALVALVYLFLRRLAIDRGGAAAGASLFVVAATAAPAWIRLTMGEPLGIMAILGAAILATRYGQARQWPRECAVLVVLLTASVLAKEMLVVLAPFVLAIALTADGTSGFRRRAMGRRDWWLVGATSVAIGIVLVAVALVALAAPRDAHASEYGTATLDGRQALRILAHMALPMRAEYPPRLQLWLLPANVLFAVLLLAGWRAVLITTQGRQRWMSLGIAALLLPVVGACEYVPWPTFNEFYGLPFLLGPAILLGVAVSALRGRGRVVDGAVFAGVAAMTGLAAMPAAYASRASMARREVNRELVQLIADHASLDSVVVAMPFVSSEAWQGVGPTVRRYAAIVAPDRPIPRTMDMLCSATIPLYRSGMGHAMLVTYADRCGVFPEPTLTLRRRFAYLYWPTLALRSDSARIDVLAPSIAPTAMR